MCGGGGASCSTACSPVLFGRDTQRRYPSHFHRGPGARHVPTRMHARARRSPARPPSHSRTVPCTTPPLAPNTRTQPRPTPPHPFSSLPVRPVVLDGGSHPVGNRFVSDFEAPGRPASRSSDRSGLQCWRERGSNYHEFASAVNLLCRPVN